jgi:hypothetical protein
MTDFEVVRCVIYENRPPAGMPAEHRLYCLDSRFGIYDLTPEGAEVWKSSTGRPVPSPQQRSHSLLSEEGLH